MVFFRSSDATISIPCASIIRSTGLQVPVQDQVEEKNDIIQGCRAGRREDQQRLYNWLAPRMLAVCRAYSKDRSEAEDLMHEGFMSVFKHIGQYRGQGSFEGWVRKIMVNVVLARYRKNHWLYPVETLPETTQLGWQEPDVRLEAAEILEMISELPPRYRMVFNLYALEGYSHQEIAGQLNITEGTSKSNLSRARQILQARLLDAGHSYLNPEERHESQG